jgi:hypothetical protein
LESNQLPSGYEPPALTDELHPLVATYVATSFCLIGKSFGLRLRASSQKPKRSTTLPGLVFCLLAAKQRLNYSRVYAVRAGFCAVVWVWRLVARAVLRWEQAPGRLSAEALRVAGQVVRYRNRVVCCWSQLTRLLWRVSPPGLSARALRSREPKWPGPVSAGATRSHAGCPAPRRGRASQMDL